MAEDLLRKLYCAKLAFGDELNVGFLDYKVSEFVKESMDLNAVKYGEAISRHVIVKDGIVHHPGERNPSSD